MTRLLRLRRECHVLTAKRVATNLGAASQGTDLSTSVGKPAPEGSNLQLEGGSEDQLLSSTAKSRGCTIAAERNSNDLGT
jgi:hypothetical protein